MVGEEQARRRPVAVQIHAEVPPGPIVAERDEAASDAVEPAIAAREDVAAAVEARPERAPAPETTERTVDVTVRLTAARAIA